MQGWEVVGKWVWIQFVHEQPSEVTVVYPLVLALLWSV